MLAGTDGPTALEQFVTRARTYRDRLPAKWDLPYGYPRGTVTAGLHAAVATTEWHLHVWDLAQMDRWGHPPPVGPGRLFPGGGRLPGLAEGEKGRAAGALVPLGARLRPWEAILRRAGRAPTRTTEGASVPATRRNTCDRQRGSASALEVALVHHDTVAADGLPVTGRTTLQATTRVVDAADRRAAVPALFGLVTVPGTGFLAPADRGVGPAVDDDRVGQAAQAVGHFAAAVPTERH